MIWNECVEWPADRARDDLGYGRVKIDGWSQRVHRATFEAIHGPLGSDEFVLHTCDNPPCYNIRHLYKGTKKDNAQDRERRGRSHHKGTPPKLSQAKAHMIRLRYAMGATQSDLAKEFGVVQSRISAVVLNKCWNLPEAATTTTVKR